MYIATIDKSNLNFYIYYKSIIFKESIASKKNMYCVYMTEVCLNTFVI